MIKQFRQILLLVLLFIIVIPASAQFGNDELNLETFVNPLFDVQGVRPQNWRETAPNSGVYLRARDRLDRTALIIQADDISQGDMLENIEQQFQLDAPPSSIDTIETDTLSWSIYKIEIAIGSQTLHTDIGLAEADDRLYIVMMQTNQVFYDLLHVELFFPVINSVAPVMTLTNEDKGYEIIVPDGWTSETDNNITTVSSPRNQVIIYVGTVDSEDGEAAIIQIMAQALPDENLAYEADAVEVEIFDRLTVVTIDFQDGTAPTGVVLRGVARIVDGVSYVTILDGTRETIRARNDDLLVFEGGFTIDALMARPTIPDTEATTEATE